MLASYGLNLWWIVGAVFLGGLLVWKYTYEFSWFHFWYGVPFVGTLGRLNDITPDSVDNSWTRAERKLCADYGGLNPTDMRLNISVQRIQAALTPRAPEECVVGKSC